MGSNVTISRAVFNAICADARSDQRRERCGLLLGRGDRVLDYIATPNVHARPETHFEVDPRQLLAVQRAERQGGLALIGHYHSHPAGLARPSVTDAAEAMADGRLWLILSASDYGLWRSVEQGEVHGRFDPVGLRIVPDEVAAAASGAVDRIGTHG